MLGLALEEFDGFSDADHDAFRPEKWRSNRFNLERMKVRERLKALGRQVVSFLAQAGLELDADVTPEQPSLWNAHEVSDLWLYLVRPAADRKTLGPVLDKGRALHEVIADPALHRRHIHMVVRVHLGGVDVGLVLPATAWIDRENARSLCEGADGMARTLEVLSDLPPHLTLWASPLAILERYRRGAAETRDAGFLEEAASRLLELGPLYHMLAWSEANDHMKLADRIGEELAAIEAHAAEAAARQEALNDAHRRREEEARARTQDKDQARREIEERFRRLTAASAPATKAAPSPKAAPAGQRRAPRPERRQGPPSRRPVRSFAEGDFVKLRRGLLAGKSGAVIGMEGDRVRVDVNGLAVRVNPADLDLAKGAKEG
jgi:sRNA-binding protein